MTSTQIRKPSPLQLLLAARLVVVVVALLGSLGAASTAHADVTDDAFLKALRDHGITYVTPASAIIAGHKMCQLLDAGQTYSGIADEVLNSSSLDAYHAGYFVGVSMAAYCPQHMAPTVYVKRAAIRQPT